MGREGGGRRKEEGGRRKEDGHERDAGEDAREEGCGVTHEAARVCRRDLGKQRQRSLHRKQHTTGAVKGGTTGWRSRNRPCGVLTQTCLVLTLFLSRRGFCSPDTMAGASVLRCLV
jgi:hypothetical protein